ncbi:MAG TPA: hypothetical protein VGM39_04875 [Kofleriaceae bacterium]|jgi:hypothetical protein
MRAVASAVALTLALATPAFAEPLPPGSLGGFFGGALGTGSDKETLGLGYLVGVQAAWQPMSTEQRANWALKWSVGWEVMNYLDPTKLGTELRFLQMNFMPGIRFRPSESRSLYLTLRAGGTLVRSNQVLPGHDGRAFVGGIASGGLDLYLGGVLASVDVSYSAIGEGPTMIGLVISLSKTGP